MTDTGAGPLQPATVTTLRRRLAAEQSGSRLPSVAAALVRGGRVAWSDAAGTLDGRADGPPATTDTQYRIGSITKTFVGVEVLRLRDERLLALDTLVADVLPELAHLGPVTIAQLLTHTAGLQSETDDAWWERTPVGPWSRLLETGIERRSTPGTTYHYSNVGYGVLGEVVARLRGRPWAEVVADLLERLGMGRTSYRPLDGAAPGLAVHPFADVVQAEPEHDGGAMAPAGQLWSTATDLARWAAFLAGDTADLLERATLEEMLRPVAVNDVPRQAWTGAHGLGWQLWNLDGRRFAGHGGSMPGFLASLAVDLESGDGAVVMANATSGLGRLGLDLLDLLREHEPPTPTPWSVDAGQVTELDLTGDWFWGTIRFPLRLERDGGLRLGDPGTGRGARFARTDDGWIGREGYYKDETLRVVRAADGSAERLELASFVFTRTPYPRDVDVPGGTGDWG